MPLLGVLAVLMAFALQAGTAWAREVPDTFADLAEKVSPAVVNISTTQTIKVPAQDMPQFPPGSPFEEFFKEFFNRRGGEDIERQATSLGSGFVIDSGGVIVTNNHVIDDADEIVVTLSDGTEYDAEIVGRDRLTDLAVLRVEADEPLPSLEFGDSDTARIGDWVMAIGNPYNLGGTVTVGIVSARSRNIQMGQYDDFIQTDAAINRGNSGGPLIDMDGHVVGINSAIFSPTGGSVGIGFAIPANQARPIVVDLLETGTVRRGWLGVGLQELTPEIAESLGLEEDKGALIRNVIEDTPAERAGVQSGDVIVEFNGKPIEDADRLSRVVAASPIGEEVKFVVLRGGKKKTLEVVLEQRDDEELMAQREAPQEEAVPSEQTLLGMELSELNDELRQQFDIGEDIQGLLVLNVERGSDAAERGIRPGVVIVQVGQDDEQAAVTSLSQLEERIEALKEDGKKFVLLRVYARGNYLWVPVQLTED